jgi:hypothetical protein
MKNERSWEDYGDLFSSESTPIIEENIPLEGERTTEKIYRELKEELSKENLEQNSINNSSNGYDFSLEADDDGGSFEEAADEGGDSDESGDEPPQMDDVPDMDSMDSGGDMSDDGGDMSGGDSDGDDYSSDDSSEDDSGIDEIDNNKGSSLNPYTQINQKQYCIDRLNELEKSVDGALETYSSQFADWSEVDQLRELLTIIREQKRSFIMQQNPENLIKIGLYYDVYDKIVQNLVVKIEGQASNNKKNVH